MSVNIGELRSILGDKGQWYMIVGRLYDEPSRIYVRDTITRSIGERKFIQEIKCQANLNKIPTLYYIEWLRGIVRSMEFEGEDDQYVVNNVIEQILNPLCENLEETFKQFKNTPAPAFFKHSCSSWVQVFLDMMYEICQFKGSKNKVARKAVPAFYHGIVSSWLYFHYTESNSLREAEGKYRRSLTIEERVSYFVTRNRVRDVYKEAIKQNLIEYYLKREFGF